MKVEPIYFGEYTNYLCTAENQEEMDLLIEMAIKDKTALAYHEAMIEALIENLDQLYEERERKSKNGNS